LRTVWRYTPRSRQRLEPFAERLPAPEHTRRLGHRFVLPYSLLFNHAVPYYWAYRARFDMSGLRKDGFVNVVGLGDVAELRR
jgi:hypothetical protein